MHGGTDDLALRQLRDWGPAGHTRVLVRVTPEGFQLRVFRDQEACVRAGGQKQVDVFPRKDVRNVFCVEDGFNHGYVARIVSGKNFDHFSQIPAAP